MISDSLEASVICPLETPKEGFQPDRQSFEHLGQRLAGAFWG